MRPEQSVVHPDSAFRLRASLRRAEGILWLWGPSPARAFPRAEAGAPARAPLRPALLPRPGRAARPHPPLRPPRPRTWSYRPGAAGPRLLPSRSPALRSRLAAGRSPSGVRSGKVERKWRGPCSLSARGATREAARAIFV